MSRTLRFRQGGDFGPAPELAKKHGTEVFRYVPRDPEALDYAMSTYEIEVEEVKEIKIFCRDYQSWPSEITNIYLRSGYVDPCRTEKMAIYRIGGVWKTGHDTVVPEKVLTGELTPVYLPGNLGPWHYLVDKNNFVVEEL